MTAGQTCPGSKDASGNIVDACSGCYAKGGNYRFKNVRDVRDRNMLEWQHANWVNDMIGEIGAAKHFRWFDSGDIYHLDLANKIELVIAGTPGTRHWLPTRSYKNAKIAAVLNRIDKLPNAVVRRSSDEINGKFVAGLHGSTIIPKPGYPTAAKECKAGTAVNHKCNGCRDCWDKQVATIAYIAHGRSMLSKLKKRGLI